MSMMQTFCLPSFKFNTKDHACNLKRLMPLETPKDIARYFQTHSVSVRPEAAKVLLEHLTKIVYNE